MAPRQGSRLGKAETEGLQNGFAVFHGCLISQHLFVGVGDSTHRCRHWLHRGQLSSRERITQHGRNNRISGDADASKGCRIADPYRVNSHNHINRGRMISATTRFNICYPLHFCGRTNFASTVHILKLLAKSQFVNPPLS